MPLPLFLPLYTFGIYNAYAEKASSLWVYEPQGQKTKTINKEQQLHRQKHCSHITADQTDVLYFHPFVAFPACRPAGLLLVACPDLVGGHQESKIKDWGKVIFVFASRAKQSELPISGSVLNLSSLTGCLFYLLFGLIQMRSIHRNN